MSNRPVFLPTDSGFPLVKVLDCEFVWHPGFSVEQKRKNIAALHAEARLRGVSNILEVSTKSPSELGKSLSAFNLRILTNSGQHVALEAAFQSSKVFENGGPYRDLLSLEGREVKKDLRLKDSGKLLKFIFESEVWPIEPKTAFYDYLYIRSLLSSKQFVKDLLDYDGFTDIEFNPQRSFSCQARSCALYVSLTRRSLLKSIFTNKEMFLKALAESSSLESRDSSPQGELPFN